MGINGQIIGMLTPGSGGGGGGGGGVTPAQLEAEATARQQADKTLQDNINAEKTARETADTALQKNITDETTARQNADKTLQENIDKKLDKPAALPAEQSVVILNADGSVITKTLSSFAESGGIVQGALVNETTFENNGGNVVTPDEQHLYSDVANQKNYVWNGTKYALIANVNDLTIGETDYTAYKGSAGKQNADDIAKEILDREAAITEIKEEITNAKELIAQKLNAPLALPTEDSAVVLSQNGDVTTKPLSDFAGGGSSIVWRTWQ